MKCQSLFSGKNKETITSLSSAEFAHKMGDIISSVFCIMIKFE